MKNITIPIRSSIWSTFRTDGILVDIGEGGIRRVVKELVWIPVYTQTGVLVKGPIGSRVERKFRRLL